MVCIKNYFKKKIPWYMWQQQQKRTSPNLGDTAKAVHRMKFIVVNTYIKKIERHQFNI